MVVVVYLQFVNAKRLPLFDYNHINGVPHFLIVCRIFKYIIAINCAIYFVNGNYLDHYYYIRAASLRSLMYFEKQSCQFFFKSLISIV